MYSWQFFNCDKMIVLETKKTTASNNKNQKLTTTDSELSFNEITIETISSEGMENQSISAEQNGIEYEKPDYDTSDSQDHNITTKFFKSTTANPNITNDHLITKRKSMSPIIDRESSSVSNHSMITSEYNETSVITSSPNHKTSANSSSQSTQTPIITESKEELVTITTPKTTTLAKTNTPNCTPSPSKSSATDSDESDDEYWEQLKLLVILLFVCIIMTAIVMTCFVVIAYKTMPSV